MTSDTVLDHSDTVLDHMAVAVEAWAEAFPRYAAELGGRWRSGGQSSGFAPCQLAFADGMRLEVLAPSNVGDKDFLRRFLEHHGRGPHHLTFKLPDLRVAIAAAEAAGYQVVNVDTSDEPFWMEAFVHPKSAPGVVVQIVQAEQPEWRTAPPEGFPASGPANPAALVHVGLAVPALDDGLRLFAALLHGQQDGSGHDQGSRWVDLAWPGRSRLRLIEPDGRSSPLVSWIGDRPGRVHHLAFSFDDPARLSKVQPRLDGIWEVDPADNLGVRLLVSPGSPSASFAAVDQGTT